MNKEDRYQVVAPGNSHAKGFHIETCRYLDDARKAKSGCSQPHVFIWDNQKKNIDGTLGGEVE